VTIRASKALLLLALAFYYTLLVFNNTNDYNSNLTFVKHVLEMDTTFPGNHGMWRAVHSPAIDMVFFVTIVIWESAIGILLWFAGIRMLSHLRSSVLSFNAAKELAVVGLTLSLLMWLTAFLSVGSEWFLMWQSKQWSGQQVADHMFAVVGIILLYIVMPDQENQA
jgi:predicted small integral membrane protein